MSGYAQPEPEPEPEPESEYATSEHASPDMIRSASELKEFEKAAEQAVLEHAETTEEGGEGKGDLEVAWVELLEARLNRLEENMIAARDNAKKERDAMKEHQASLELVQSSAASAAELSKTERDTNLEEAIAKLEERLTTSLANAGGEQSVAQREERDGIAAQLEELGASSTEAAARLEADLAKCTAHLGEVEQEARKAQQEARKAQRTAEDAGVSRHELNDLTQKLVGVREDCGVLEARKAERSALAELGSTLHEAFQGGLDGLEKQLGGLVGAAVASEVAKIDTVLAGLQAEREAGSGARDTAELREELQGLTHRLGGKAGREELLQLQRGLASLKPGGQSEERLQRIRDALLGIHDSMMETKADKSQLARVEAYLATMSNTARPTSPAGTRGAMLHASPRPLSERLLVGHVSDGGISSSRVQPGGALTSFMPPSPLARSGSPSQLGLGGSPSAQLSPGPPMVRFSGAGYESPSGERRLPRPASAAALLPPRPQAEYDRAVEGVRAEAERMVAESVPELHAVEAHTFELPQPSRSNTFLTGRERPSTAGPTSSNMAGREREVREQPVRLPVAGKEQGAARRMLPGKDGRLYKAGRGA